MPCKTIPREKVNAAWHTHDYLHFHVQHRRIVWIAAADDSCALPEQYVKVAALRSHLVALPYKITATPFWISCLGDIQTGASTEHSHNQSH